jgi:predicted nucleotidyltransferase component of viral defense system
MKNKLHYNTITPLLHEVLLDLMKSDEFNNFRLVGGTSLSLQRGHRFSVDIDLFSDAAYGSIDFNAIDTYLRSKYSYVDSINIEPVGMGKSYFVGTDRLDNIKLDLYYTDKFIQDALMIDGIRLATIEEIIAMKLNVVSRKGRKKDFWDIHELIEEYTLQQMLELHEQRYPYEHNAADITNNFSDFSTADLDLEPICLRNKQWQLIKLDIIEYSKT